MFKATGGILVSLAAALPILPGRPRLKNSRSTARRSRGP